MGQAGLQVEILHFPEVVAQKLAQQNRGEAIQVVDQVCHLLCFEEMVPMRALLQGHHDQGTVAFQLVSLLAWFQQLVYGLMMAAVEQGDSIQIPMNQPVLLLVPWLLLIPVACVGSLPLQQLQLVVSEAVD